MTAPRQPDQVASLTGISSPLDGVLLVDQGRGLLGLYHNLCRPAWLELLAPLPAALDDPMPNLERLLAVFAPPAWEAAQSRPFASSEDPSPSSGETLPPVQPRASRTTTLRSPTPQTGEIPVPPSFPSTHSGPPETVLQSPVSSEAAGYSRPWEAEPGEDAKPETPLVSGVQHHRSFNQIEMETEPLPPAVNPAVEGRAALQAGAAQNTPQAAGAHPFSPLATRAASPTPRPAASQPGQPELAGLSNTSGVVRLATGPARLASLLQASLRADQAGTGSPSPETPIPSPKGPAASAAASMASLPPASPAPSGADAYYPASILPPGIPASPSFSREARDLAQLERLVDEQFARWLEQLELAYLRSYGTSGG